MPATTARCTPRPHAPHCERGFAGCGCLWGDVAVLRWSANFQLGVLLYLFASYEFGRFWTTALKHPKAEVQTSVEKARAANLTRITSFCEWSHEVLSYQVPAELSLLTHQFSSAQQRYLSKAAPCGIVRCRALPCGAVLCGAVPCCVLCCTYSFERARSHSTKYHPAVPR